jgi:predicted outer membrane repeat protein
MWFPSWLRHQQRSPFVNKRPTFRPTLEALEDRWVPSTLTVQNNHDSGTGSLRAAIASADNGDTINFAPSLDGQTITLTSGELLLRKNLTISGPGASQLTISGNKTRYGVYHYASRVFELSSLTKPQVTLSGLTISNGDGLSATGSSYGQGGAILNDGTLTVSSCIVSGNSAIRGGGIYNDQDGSLLVSSSTLSGNSATGAGGGIFDHGGNTMTISSSILSGNFGGWGGAVDVDIGTVEIDNCTLKDNFATGAGGGIFDHGGNTVTISSSILSGNFGGWGGAVDVDSGTMQIDNCMLNSNSAKVIGGAIYCAGTLAVNGSTLSGNSANAGGGILNDGTLTITNCTLSNNSAFNGGGILNRYGSSTLSDSKLTGNSATNAGGGIYIYGGQNSGTVTVKNSSSITGNTAPASSGADVYNQGVLDLDSTSIIGILDGNPANPI